MKLGNLVPSYQRNGGIGVIAEFFKKNLSLKIIAVILAIILWFYAIGEENPERMQNLYDIPVEIVNIDKLNGKNLTLAEEPINFVTIRVKGLVNDLRKINVDNIKAVLDLGEIDWVGTNDVELKMEGYLPREVSLEKIPKVSVTIDNIKTKPIPVDINVTGNGSDGYYVHEATAEPPTITIYGAQSLVDRVVHGEVQVKLDQDEGTIKQSLPVKLVDAEGNEVKSEYLKLRQDSVMVTIPIHPIKSLDIKANVVGEPAEGFVLDDVVVDPERITINGYDNTVKRLTSLLTEPIDIQGATEDIHTTVDLVIENGIYLEPGQPSKVNVVVNISETTIESELVINEVELRNLPEGFEASTDALSITVHIKGPYTLVQPMTALNLTPYVDLSQIDTEAEGFESGAFDLPLSLNLPSGVKLTKTSSEVVTVNLQAIEGTETSEEGPDVIE